MSSMSKAKIEKKAKEVLLRTKCYRLPVPLEAIAQRLGLTLESTPLGDDISGVLVLDGERGVIGYNATHPRVRQRFTIAHECAHFLLHARSSKLFIDKKYRVYARNEQSSTGEDRMEVEANQLAAALLMPEELVREEVLNVGFDLGDERALETLANEFQVSRLAMSHRLANLNILNKMS